MGVKKGMGAGMSNGGWAVPELLPHSNCTESTVMII